MIDAAFSPLDVRAIGPWPFLHCLSQLLDRWFQDKSVTASVKGPLLEVVSTRVGENYDVSRHGAQLSDELKAVGIRERQINNGDVEPVFVVLLDRVARRSDRGDFETHRPKELAQHFACIWIIIDDDHPRRHAGSLARWRRSRKKLSSPSHC
jgi:hypothetical protein